MYNSVTTKTKLQIWKLSNHNFFNKTKQNKKKNHKMINHWNCGSYNLLQTHANLNQLLQLQFTLNTCSYASILYLAKKRIISHRPMKYITVFITMLDEQAFFHAPIFENHEHKKLLPVWTSSQVYH